MMIAEGLWKPKKAHKATVHQMRERRACFGELVQIDGSPHDWFEGRAPACSLLVFIDDASGRLGQLSFVKSESFFSYSQAAREYFTRYGKPVAFYSDKHGIFRVNQRCCRHNRRPDAVRTSHAATGYPDHLCAHPTGQGTGGTGHPDLAGSFAQGTAFAQHLFLAGRQCLSARVHERFQPALCSSAPQ